MGLDKLLFRQERVGKGGVPVTVFKIETMVGERRTVNPLERLSGRFSEVNNVTPIGSILRHLGLDEIPQLINLVRGEVQSVGFRILRQCELEKLPDDIREFYLSRKPSLISGDGGIGNPKGDLELKYRYMREFMALIRELEADKSISGTLKLKMTLMRLAIKSYVNKIIDPISFGVVLRKLKDATGNLQSKSHS